MSDTAFLERIKAFEGRRVSDPVPGPDPVNVPMIRHLVQALEDDNPVYLDEAAAARSVHGGLIAPPTSLQVWIMQGLSAGNGTRGDSAQDQLLGMLDEAGFTSVVATNCEQEYFAEIRPGDHLSVEAVIDSVSDEKATGLGMGHFVTTRQIYRDQHGNHVADMLFRILKFKPKAAAREQQKPPRPRPSITHDNAFFFEGAAQGKLLIQKCRGCGMLHHPPKAACECGSFEFDTVEATGRGTVYSFVVNHYPQVPAFDYPLAVGLIELEEGVRMVSDIIGIDPADVRIGMPVEVEFVKFDDELTLPQFRPVAGGVA
ncbi:MAG TPA: bifunctional MaoC family dehydratase N-terminal/OB-fold nucleic acid binding domain-containing protein [Acidimicrobiales bacterium]|jgi:uncharacterized OB-fold protein/acyl dehydratase|nr:bifunctional MaoC family dehydratase N-terminal/OB-fold nucleic acid binding domain-containing protein [Acidimicrobiales bacterium]